MENEKWKAKEVLITGGLGFLGSNIAHKLVEKGAKVTVFDAALPEFGANPANIEEIKEKISVVKGDIRNKEAIRKAVEGKEIIFNCAAQISHTGSMKNPFLDIDINCKGQITLLEAVRLSAGNPKIVFSATSSQVGKMLYCPIDELHPEFPTDVYSANKSVGEKYHLIYNNVYGIPVVSLRLSNMYGPRALIKSAEVGVINYFIGLALQGKEITLFEPGTQNRQALFVEDAVNAMILAAENPAADGEIFFVCPSEKHKLVEIAEKIIIAAGSGSLALVPWPNERKGIEIGDVFISNKKISETLGWKTENSLEEGLRKTIDYFAKKKEAYL